MGFYHLRLGECCRSGRQSYQVHNGEQVQIDARVSSVCDVHRECYRKTYSRYYEVSGGGGKKLVEFAERVKTKPDCERCKRLYHDKGEEPDCDSCIPPLLPVNQDVYRIYSVCQGQWIVGMGGAIDIDLKTLFRVMDVYDIPNESQRIVSERVRKLSQHMLKTSHDEAEQKRKEEAAIKQPRRR